MRKAQRDYIIASIITKAMSANTMLGNALYMRGADQKARIECARQNVQDITELADMLQGGELSREVENI